ncbi:MAG: hypothetical protein IBJ03_05075 [Gemmatimonadaceae bacterium]|nr:hypothetical protein [Gemmatimonadaceae bacterium]
MIASHRTPEPLLALREVTAEWRAGMPPACSIAARMLDRVHLVVCRGDCVVVRHEDPAAARVLLAALEGGVPWHRLPGWNGTRTQAAGVRVRRASIRAAVIPAVLEGWRDLEVRSLEIAGQTGPGQVGPVVHRSPVVHLLRGSREGAVPRHELQAWRRWARSRREAGGALVIVAPTPDGRRPASTTSGPEPVSWAAEHRGRLHERPERATPATNVRTLWLHHGRVHDLHFTTPPSESILFGQP